MTQAGSCTLSSLLAAAASLLLTLPIAAQSASQSAPLPGTNANGVLPAATLTAPPKGYAQQIALWPDRAPLQHGSSEGDVPKLFTYPVTASFGAAPHAAVIVMPGGGYTHLVMEQEGAYEAGWLAAHGVTAFVLEYRLAPAYVYPAQMLDASRAIRYVRAHAAELGVDPHKLGVWGFSAGGHLAGYLATMHHGASAAAPAAAPSTRDAIDQQSDRPDFAIISYGGLSLDINSLEGKTPMASILGQHPTQTVIDAIDPVKHVTADTSPCFIYSTTADQTVSSLNAAEFYIALKRAGVLAEMHVFEVGQHGTHMAEDTKPGQEELKVYPELLMNWMALHGWMTAGQAR